MVYYVFQKVLAKRKAKGNSIVIVGSAEIKIIIALIYYIMLGVATLVFLTLSQLRTGHFHPNREQDINNYVVVKNAQGLKVLTSLLRYVPCLMSAS